MDKGFRRQTKLLKFKVELCLVFKTLIISFIVISIYEDAVFCILFLCQQRRSDESLIKSWWNWVVTDNYMANRYVPARHIWYYGYDPLKTINSVVCYTMPIHIWDGEKVAGTCRVTSQYLLYVNWWCSHGCCETG